MAFTTKIFLLLVSFATASNDVCKPGESGESCAINKDEVLEVESATVSLLQSKLETVKMHQLQEEEADPKQPSQRALLSQRGNSTRRGCEWCTCFITDAAKCGYDFVTDAARCGWKTVTSGVTCGYSSTQKCGFLLQQNATTNKAGDEDNKKDSRSLLTQRQAGRRRKNWFKKAVKTVSCWVETVAKSCSVAASCNVAKSCDVSESFGDCFNEIKSEAKKAIGKAGEYMDLVSDTACSSVDACEKKVTDGLKSTWTNVIDKALGPIEDEIVENVEALVPNAKETAGKLVDNIADLGKQAGESVTKIANSVTGYFSNNFSPLDFGDCCLRGDEGFWWMKPTDCGAFKKMGKVFTDIPNAKSHFNDALDSFEECVQFTGMLGVPTPFFELKFWDYCLPDFIKVPMEYIGGAVKFVGDAADDLVGSITTVIGQVKDFAKNNLDLSLLGKTIAKRRLNPDLDHHEVANMSLAEHQQGGGECGDRQKWTVALSLTWGMSYTEPDGSVYSFGFIIGMFVGCKNNRLLDPAPLFGAYLSNPTMGSVPDEKDVGFSGGLSGNLGYSDSYYAFSLGKQASVFMTFDMALKGDVEKITGKSIPVEASLNVFFPYPPVAAPSGFQFTLAGAGKAKATLQQSDAHLKKKMARHGDKLTSNHVMEAIAHGMNELVQKDVHHELKSMYGGYSKETTVHHNAVHTALNIDKHRLTLAQMAQQVEGAQKPELSLLQAKKDEEASAEVVKDTAAQPVDEDDLPISISTGNSINLMLCLEFPCRGQD